MSQTKATKERSGARGIEIRVGTSAFTAAGWENAFYPPGMKPADYLSYYATKFDTVEVDSTFYRTPSAATVNGWNRKTPDDFVFALKVPQLITHERVLEGCDSEFKEFVETADLLGPKLGPLLLQFGYFNKSAFKSLDEFLARLQPFLKKLPKDHKYALEIRNKNWLVPKLFDLLREYGVAYTMIDQAWMPRPEELLTKGDPITADFTYIRFLGDRKGIEQQTKVWDRVIVDRRADLTQWTKMLRELKKLPSQVYTYANNHYAGYAPMTVELFWDLLQKVGFYIRRERGERPEIETPTSEKAEAEKAGGAQVEAAKGKSAVSRSKAAASRKKAQRALFD